MKRQRTLIGVLILGFLLVLTGGMIQAQELESDADMSPYAYEVDPVYGTNEPEPDNGISEDEIEAEARVEDQELESENGIELVGMELGAVSAIVPIQGRLTDASGKPLNGSYSVRARIYDVSSGGDALCDDTDTVTVDNGLFNMNMNFCSASDISGEQLYLGITVESDDEMTPRQAIYPVPYAWTVKSGAIIRGGTTYHFTPGGAFIKYNSADTTRWIMYGGSARIYRGATAGSKYIYIPIELPSVLYGRDVRVTYVRVYYRCQDGNDNYITDTYLYKHTDADSWNGLVNDGTDRKSNAATSYSLATNSDYNTLSSTQGVLTLRLQLAFANDTEYVMINGVRLTLVTDY